MTVRVRPAATVGPLERLEPLARRIFGEGDRPPRWFARKLARECVDPELSQVAVGPDDQPVGYLLVGRPPSLAPRARTAGTGVVPEQRGRGLGAALVRAAMTAAANAGCSPMMIPAEAAVAGFYARLGLRPEAPRVTLVGFGRSANPQSSQRWSNAPRPWSLAALEPCCGWLAEAWERTPAEQRTTLELGGLVVHVALEGCSYVIHRVLTPAPSAPTVLARHLDALLERMRNGAPVCLLGVTDGDLVAALEARGWAVAQRSIDMIADAPASAESAAHDGGS